MTETKTPFGWVMFVVTACSKSLLDISRFYRDGTFDTLFYGRQAFAAHPGWCCVNILLDVGSVLGAVVVIRKAAGARWRRVDG